MENTMNSSTVRAALHQIRREMSAAFIQREELVEAMLLALVCKQHVVAISPPGCAKSAVARGVASSMQASYFERLLSRFSTEEDLFGPRSLAAMKADRWERVTGSTLVDADVAFLDEIFKCNGSMLNALLTILNERVYHNGNAGSVQVPLWSVLAASNELPEDESLGALYDRFLFRLKVDYISDDSCFDRMLDDGSGAYTSSVRISRDELEAAHVAAMAIDSPSLAGPVKAQLRHIREALSKQGVIVSDRRWKQSVSALRAAAWLDGSDHVELDHLEVLRWTLWSAEEHIPVVKAVLASIDTGVVGDCVRLIDDALREWEARPGNPADYYPKLDFYGHVLDEAVRQVEARCSNGITKRAAEKIDRKLVAIEDARNALRKDVAARWGLNK